MKENLIILRALSFLLFICIIFIGNQFIQKKEQINSTSIPSTKVNSVSQQTISATE